MEKTFRILASIFTGLILSGALAAQGHLDRFNSIDIQSYRFEITLWDTTDVIGGIAEIQIKFKKDIDQFELDLAYNQDDNSGMKVEEISENGEQLEYLHRDNSLTIFTKATKGSQHLYRIKYHGEPKDGLIISKNKFGDRTFFGDNWPNRGHNWLPLVDHPSDKAIVEFLVAAPDHYGIVSVGELLSERTEGDRLVAHWKTRVPLSTKLMVIGVSPFAIDRYESSSGIPVSSWVYPQNAEEGFYDYRLSTKALDFFEEYIAPYPYAKLANVQSKTIYGGMENASCIFYHERSVTGTGAAETLLTHEIAHQWFGDAVSEADWHHIWLSEGFATYLSDMYLEHSYGAESFQESLIMERDQVIRYFKHKQTPVIDTSATVSVKLLNANTYDKAGWFLHMLRRDLGDETFQKVLQTYYEKFKFGNALTSDFRDVVEEITGKGYQAFFHQWLRQLGHPVIGAEWEEVNGQMILTIRQEQKTTLFDFPLEIEIIGENGMGTRKILEIYEASHTFNIDLPFQPEQVILDPDIWLLFEEGKF